MRKAIVERASSYATGKRCDIERITHRLEEGHWRRAERYLAGGLSYCKHGSEDEQERCLSCLGTLTRAKALCVDTVKQNRPLLTLALV